MLTRLVVPLVLFAASCAAPAPSTAGPTARPTSAASRNAPAPTATPDPAASSLGIIPLRIDEAAVPPAEPTPEGFPSGRATPTPAATPDATVKFVTIVLAIENRSDTARLVGLGGADPRSTNLSAATLTTRDGTRYKPVRSTTSFGLRTATGRSLTSYPVLLRLPPGFRAGAESFGALSIMAPLPTSVTFRVPADVTEYGTLSIPPLTSLGPKSGDDDVSKRLRPLLGGFQSLSLSGLRPGAREAVFPTAESPSGLLSVGQSASGPGNVTATLVSVEADDPADYQARNRGWKELTLGIRYRNEDTSQTRTFTVSAWLFGADGVVYSGDVPAVGDFGRALTPPEPGALLIWDGRAAGLDAIPPGQEPEPRRATFLVPRALQNGILVLAGDIEAQYAVRAIPTPPQP